MNALTFTLLLIIKGPGDVHGSSMRVPMPDAVTCAAARERALASNVKVRAAGIAQQMVAVCVRAQP